MRENPSQTRPTHYRIYVYASSVPPLGQPIAVSLCPWKRSTNGPLSGDVTKVTCKTCLQHINSLGLPPTMWMQDLPD